MGKLAILMDLSAMVGCLSAILISQLCREWFSRRWARAARRKTGEQQ